MLLAAILALPLFGALVVALMPREEERACRHMGLVFTLLTFFASCGLAAFNYKQGELQLELVVPWISALGINFHLGVDGLSLWLVLLTTFLGPVVLLSSYSGVTARAKDFVVAMLVLEGAMIGAYVSLDLFLFYVFWELMLVPMYLLIGVWGHGDRTYAAIKFVLYTAVGSLLMLVAVVYVYVTHGQATGDYTFDYTVLMQSVWATRDQMWLFGAFALAFAIKVPLFPLHTWLPDAHTQAPTAGSVVLAAVLLKMGTYGFLRFAIPMFPYAAAAYAPYLVVLSVVGIVYGALVAYAQNDAKRLIAYSSVSHLGFVMLGLLAMNEVGIQGSIFQMLSHGISTGALFLVIGVLYDRRHTHELNQFGGLWKRMPIFAGLFMIIMLASAGLPGLNGFVGEFMVLVGSFTHHLVMNDGQQLWFLRVPLTGVVLGPRFITAVAATGVVLGAIYLLRLFQKLMFGPIKQRANAVLEDLSGREIATFLPLIVMIFVMGLYPEPFLRPMRASVKLFLKEYKIKYAASEQQDSGKPMRLPELAYRSKRPIEQLSAPRPKPHDPDQTHTGQGEPDQVDPEQTDPGQGGPDHRDEQQQESAAREKAQPRDDGSGGAG